MPTIEQIDDITMSTLPSLQKGNLAQMAQTMQETVVMRDLFTKERVEKQGGINIQHRIVDTLPGAARMIYVDDEDNVSIPQLIDKVTFPWVHFETSYGWIIETDILVNAGPAEIVNVLKTRRDMCKVETAEFMETKMWSLRDAADDKSPNGIPYYICKDATATAAVGTFSGGEPTGFTDVAGVDVSAHPNYQNYCHVYENITADDLVYRIRLGMDKTGFKSHIGKDEFYSMNGRKWQLYVNTITKLAIEDIGRGQNENVGNDIAQYDGQTVIRGCRLNRVVPLDSDAENPVYGLNMNTFKMYVLKGAFFRESKQMVNPRNHRGRQVFTDCTFNLGCVNRRHNFVLHDVV